MNCKKIASYEGTKSIVLLRKDLLIIGKPRKL